MRPLIRIALPACAAVALTCVLAPSANALTDDQIIAQCNSGVAKCTIEDLVRKGVHQTPAKRVSSIYQNCAEVAKASYWLEYSYTTSITEGITITATAEIGGGTPSASPAMTGAVKAGIQAAYKKEWTDSTTVTNKKQVDVSPGKSSWLEVSAAKDVVSATLITNYDSAVDGHRQWKLPNRLVAVPLIDGAPSDVITVKEGKADCSGKATGETGGKPIVTL